MIVAHNAMLIDDHFAMELDQLGNYGLAYDSEQRILKFGNARFVLPDGEATCAKLFACRTTGIKGSREQLIKSVIENDLVTCVGSVKPAEYSNHTDCKNPCEDGAGKSCTYRSRRNDYMKKKCCFGMFPFSKNKHLQRSGGRRKDITNAGTAQH